MKFMACLAVSSSSIASEIAFKIPVVSSFVYSRNDFSSAVSSLGSAESSPEGSFLLRPIASETPFHFEG
ncbi:unnamed protein product [Chondrus crispus]|uniref:Uncharacterized protein n=1 Tax=Chondrus crispus TaxID=2769 RepID=R7QF59_CHOCR|nr:unnamed protein product [Chondrus crispus]CDF36040.1 unnamed protein product [Chondrus crispus]|eukprot:XP_005715859.1 unnamed protein product [Chondrus crispus]